MDKNVEVNLIDKNREVNMIDIVGYGVSNLGYGLITQMLSAFLVFYSTVILRIPGSLIGLIIAISVLWDAVSDPIMGFISDNTDSKYGRRHIYILLGAIFVALTNLLLWNINADLSMWNKFIWILLSVLLIKTFVTVFVTPYSALGAELSNDYNKRSMIQAIKTIFFLLAIFFVTAVSMFVFFRPTAEYQDGQLNPIGYRNLAIASSLVMVVTGLITFFKTKKYIPYLPKANIILGNSPLKEFFLKIKFTLSNGDYRAIFFGYLFTNLASAIISTIGLHTFTYSFYLNNYKIGVVFGVQFAISIISQPIWAKISEKIDKPNAVNLGLRLSIFGCIILFGFVFMREQIKLHYEYLLIYATVIGFGSSGLFSIPLSMIADTVDQQEYETGERNEGVYYGMLNFGYKISQAIAIFVFGILLDLIQFDAALGTQTKSTSMLLGISLSLGSLIAFASALIAYSKYSLNETSVTLMQDKIIKRNSL